MKELSYELVEKLKKECVPGTRVRCKYMDDPYHPIPINMEGTVEKVDDSGTVHVKWDNGSFLGLIPDVDEFEKVDKKNKRKQKEICR